MKRLTAATLTDLCDQLAAHPWRENELRELVDPRLGVITGFQKLLDELEVLRQVDLGDIPPAQDMPPRRQDQGD